MANKNPTPPPERSRWKKGQSGNPAGGKKHDPALKRLKNLTKTELIDIGNLVIKGNIVELKAIAKNPDATVIQTMLASVAVKIIEKGDMSALDVLLNRLVGKVKEEIHASIDQANPPQIIVTLPSNGREAKIDDK